MIEAIIFSYDILIQKTTSKEHEKNPTYFKKSNFINYAMHVQLIKGY